MTRGIECALWGSASRDAETRESKAGNQFAIVNLVVYDGTTDDQGRQVGQFVKVLAFGQHVNAARQIKKFDRCYAEGSLTASIWKASDGEPRIDLTVKAFKLERAGIGKSRPPRSEGRTSSPYQAPQSEFYSDDIGF